MERQLLSVFTCSSLNPRELGCYRVCSPRLDFMQHLHTIRSSIGTRQLERSLYARAFVSAWNSVLGEHCKPFHMTSVVIWLSSASQLTRVRQKQVAETEHTWWRVRSMVCNAFQILNFPACTSEKAESHRPLRWPDVASEDENISNPSVWFQVTGKWTEATNILNCLSKEYWWQHC